MPDSRPPVWIGHATLPSNDVARELLRRQPGSVVPVRVPDRGHVNRPRVGRMAPPAPYRPR